MKTSFRLPRSRERIWALASVLALGVYGYGCGGGSDCGGPFCIGIGQPAPTHLTLGGGDGQTGATGRELPDSIEVLVTDDDLRPVPDVLVTFSVGQGGGSLAETEIRSDVHGRAWTHWTLGTEPGAQSAQAAASGTSGSPLNGSPLTFSAQAVRPPPARIVLRQAPSVAARNGIALDQQPIVEVLDSDDQPVPQVQVTAAIASGGGTLSGGTAVVSDAAGRAAYSDLALVGPSGARTLRFTVAAPALEVVSGTIMVGAGGPAQLTGVAPLTYQGTVGSPVDPAPSVVVKDAAGNPVPGVSVSFTADRDASISPEMAITDDSGVAQVTNWTLGTTANVQYTLTARVEGSSLTPVRFTAMARAGAAGRLSVTTQPSATAQNGSPFAQQPVIQVVDRDGNPAPQADVQITASIAAGPNGALLNATASTDAGGLATFSGLTPTGTAGNYTISFSAQGLTGVMSNPIALGAGPATQLAVAVTPPTPTRSRVVLGPVIQLQDVSGNPVAQAGTPVIASVDAGTLMGSSTVSTGADGRALFTDLAIAGSPGLKTLTFSSTGLQAVSAQVTLRDVAKIFVNTATPASATVGTTLSAVPIGILADVAGQPVADAPFTLTPGVGTVSVSPSTGISGADGTVTADSWQLGTTAGDQEVVIRVSETVAPLLVRIQGTAAAPDSLTKISGDDPIQSAPPGTDLASAFVVQVLDQYGNGVPGVFVQWRACDGSVDKKTPTDGSGSTSIVVTTESQPGPSCVKAHYPGADVTQVKGSPVTFNYTVTGSPSVNQSSEFKAPVFTPQKVPSSSPRPRGVHR
jgi:adhesin/invasin